MTKADNANDLHLEFVGLLNELINKSSVLQHDMASQLGYTNANIISMFKAGRTRVPLEKVPVLARAMDYPVKDLLRQWFESYRPDTLVILEAHMGAVLTENEMSWLSKIRDHFGNRIPPASSEGLAGIL